MLFSCLCVLFRRITQKWLTNFDEIFGVVRYRAITSSLLVFMVIRITTLLQKILSGFFLRCGRDQKLSANSYEIF